MGHVWAYIGLPMTPTLRRKLSQHGSPQGGLSARALLWSGVVHLGQYTAVENIQINFHTEV